MIKVTDEMRAAFGRIESTCYEDGCGDCLNERLAAVLAIVERDYVVRVRQPHPACAEFAHDYSVRGRCIWCDRPEDDHRDAEGCGNAHPGSPCQLRDWVGEPFLACEVPL